MMDSIHNYYERLVIEEVQAHYSEQLEDELLADMACIALNLIPPRYIRYDIDMSFFLTPKERIKIEEKVRKACRKAYKKILELPKKNSSEPPQPVV
ncbi:late competence development ComFB family protein [Thiomicrorhabdus xiamenensis]|uniref:Late competence development ComFB family protein n=1 Tax=Thiomicrorhabdus xiamenensis TaxID=2739063 RepID=A0A7D4NXJ7_9GAMM|nr:late competence development ComFB family protein [Thiomicrorhabdus xiamenensis]QKI88578.1 late competence development ComFB family protein [Thiomicrorhabdus xiamenensis]